jgi:putative effector of murein hydrolase
VSAADAETSLGAAVRSPLFGVLLTLAAYEVGQLLYRRLRHPLASPPLWSITLIVAVLLALGVPVEAYMAGARYLTFLLGPGVVALALPLYRQMPIIRANGPRVAAGVLAGTAAGVASAYLLALAFGGSPSVARSMIPKSVTVPVGVILSERIGGEPVLTAFSALVAGISGPILGPALLARLLPRGGEAGLGFGLGSASHVLGTIRAMEAGPVAVSFASLATGLAALATTLLAPLFVRLVAP